MIILNSGGTLNKIYDPIKGRLVVPKHNRAVEEIMRSFNVAYAIDGCIYKDSLEMDERDREILVEKIASYPDEAIVVVHGTDTMDVSAAFVAEHIQKRCIVFTGAMVPFSIDKKEASANVALAVAKALYMPQNGVFIAMHGIVERFDRVYKDRQRGLFCRK